jgi:DnaK suppressor protein
LKAKDLQFFEEILNERKAQLQKNIISFAEEQAGAQRDDLKDEGDLASASGGAIISDAIITQQRKELEEIEYAFKKMKDGSYGTCEMCEDPIGMPRLKAKPFARYCIVCREIVEKENKAKGK